MTVSRFFRRLGVTLKKDAHRARAGSCGHNAPQSALAKPPKARRYFAARLHRRDLDQDQHDTALRLGPARRAPRRQDPEGKWKTATFLAALRNDRIEAPCVFDGPINGERFRAYVQQFLIPTLKPNDIVVLDNLGSHKGKAVRKAVKAAGARLLFLPKYSPDLNPIEQVFAKIKGFVRKAVPRTLDAISHAIAQALATIPPAECQNYLAGAGYAPA